MKNPTLYNKGIKAEDVGIQATGATQLRSKHLHKKSLLSD
jgi:hypothetical protein